MTMCPMYSSYNELTNQKVTEKVIAPNGNSGTVTYEWQYGYDANSNRTEAKVQRSGTLLDKFGYTWDAQNRLIELSKNGVPIQKNSYELNGYRVEKHDVQDKTITQYTVDSALKLLSETRIKPEGENNPRQTYRYLYMGNQRIARVETDDKTQKDRVLYYHNDPMGTPIMMTIQDTSSTQNYYGVSHQAMDPWGYELRAGYFTGTNDVIYTQKTLDQSTGLYDFGYRFYDREIGAWLGKDLEPAKYERPLTLNPFVAMSNNPVNRVDPDGKSDVYFSNTEQKIMIKNSLGDIIGTFPAANNISSLARGPFPEGFFSLSHYKDRAEFTKMRRPVGPDEAYGSVGIFVFNVPGRPGLGLHSGRANKGGYLHPTMGCIRTTDEAMNFLDSLNKFDPVKSISVNSGAFDVSFKLDFNFMDTIFKPQIGEGLLPKNSLNMGWKLF